MCTYEYLFIIVSRLERPPINQSKQALSNMLRQRQPLGGAGAFPSAGGGQHPAMTPQHRPPYSRQQPRPPPPHHMQIPGQQGFVLFSSIAFINFFHSALLNNICMQLQKSDESDGTNG